jgi:hypothetical protein
MSRLRSTVLAFLVSAAVAASFHVRLLVLTDAARAAEDWPKVPKDHAETAIKYSTCNIAAFEAHRAGQIFDLSLNRIGCPQLFPTPVYSNQDPKRAGLFFTKRQDLDKYIEKHPQARNGGFEIRRSPTAGQPNPPYPFGNCEGGECVVLEVGHRLRALEPFLFKGRVHDTVLGDGYLICVVSVLIE